MTFRWGILGCGQIANDFVNSLKSVDGAQVTACAARSLQKASTFAEGHGIPKAYDSYEKLCRDEDVDIIYVATLHTTHYEHSLLALNAKKHVLVEKPMAMNVAQAKRMIQVAKDNELFLMEGMWTRFFPSIRRVRDIIDNGTIGEVHSVTADFGVQMPLDVDRLWKKELGGGGLLDIGIYPIAFVSMVFGGQKPENIAVSGKLATSGVDLLATINLEYSNARFGTVQYTMKSNTPEEVTIVGSKGYIRIHSPAHCSEKITVVVPRDREEASSEEHSFPIPAPHEKCLPFNFPGSNAFQFEARTVQDCIAKGLKTCSEYPLEESLTIMEILDSVRQQLGVHYGELEDC